MCNFVTWILIVIVIVITTMIIIICVCLCMYVYISMCAMQYVAGQRTILRSQGWESDHQAHKAIALVLMNHPVCLGYLDINVLQWDGILSSEKKYEDTL